MKAYATSLIIAVMTVGLFFALLSRPRAPHEAPAEAAQESTRGKDASGDAGSSDAGPADAAAQAPVDAAPVVPARPLRVATLGWDLAAAAAAPPPEGSSTGPRLEIAPEVALAEIEARLARGGDDARGADVAVLPLPAFVSSFERLRALEPRAFLVVGFSRGREELHAATGALLEPPPAAGEVKLVALGPTTAADPAARAAGSESATVFGLFALDLLGVAPARLRFVAPGAPDAAGAPYAALVRGATDERKLALSTVDASRFVPIVAVAPRALLDAREAELGAWARAWLGDLARSSKDVPGVARRLASKEGLPLAAGVGGAPEALALVERLGQIDDATIEQQPSYLGPRATGPVTLDALAQRTWRLARGAGLASAAPEPLPIDGRIAAAIAPPPKERGPAGAADAGASFGSIPSGATALVAYRAASDDAAEIAAQIAFLSGVFERALFEIRAKGGERSARAIASAALAKGVAGARLVTSPDEPRGASAVVVLLSPP